MSTMKISKVRTGKSINGKDVALASHRELREWGLECPINAKNGLNPDIMLHELFDNGHFVLDKLYGNYIALGFIDGVPAKCEYRIGMNFTFIDAILPSKYCSFKSWGKTLPERTSRRASFSQVEYWSGGCWYITFYYRPE